MTLELAKRSDGNLVEGLRNHHPGLSEWLSDKHPLCISTDDPGVFDTNATKELYLLAKAYDLDKHNLKRLTLEAVNHIFCDDTTKQRIKNLMRERLDTMMMPQETC
jgi:adenosine deaminase